MDETTTDVHQILKNTYGYTDFRGQQEEIINHVLHGKNAMVIMPTGGGKSICYQIPAIVKDGLTIVISPLIALMEDQVVSLQQMGVEAAYLHSGMSAAQRQELHQKLDANQLKLLYTAPESFVQDRFLRYLSSFEISLFAIDEAHCISVWGNDFRPEYTKLKLIRERFADVPIIALTATADEATRQDIMQQLGIADAKLFLSSFERNNLMITAQAGIDRINRIERFLSKYKDESGIVYCLSRKSTEDVASKLKDRGFSAAYYHAGMDSTSRSRIQTRFQNDEIKIVCATIAFGMGIDKSNVRFVVHYNLPKNIESFYQEIGRAGRDGLPSETLLFYSWADHTRLKSFIEDSPGNEDFKDVQNAKLDRMWEFANAAVCRTNMILSYFGEYKNKKCGHCDNCLYPPEVIEGTILTQKALSAIYRTKQQVNIHQLLDVLKGNPKDDIRSKGWDQIKTFGAGRDLPYTHWRTYCLQMINQGLIQVDYARQNKLRLTPLSKSVLSGDMQVNLVAYQKPSEKQKTRKVSKKAVIGDELFEKLREWRKQKAQEINAPAYVIFHDATLREIAEQKPIVAEDLMMIDGIGDTKRQRFGEEIIEVIRQYTLTQTHSKKMKGRTYLQTLALYKEGLTPFQISLQRKMNIVTVYSHLAALYERGEAIDIQQYVTDEEIDKVLIVAKNVDVGDQLKPIHEALNGEMDYYKIRLALSWDKRNN